MHLSKKIRVAAVGTGSRFWTFAHAIATTHRDECELVALCDEHAAMARTRAADLAREFGYPELPIYASSDFDRMVIDQQVDLVLVTSVDGTHDRYVCRALDLGANVVTEKPMTTDAEKCRAILEAARRNPEKEIRVAFNYRWSDRDQMVKEFLDSGAIGEVLAIHLEYNLDTSHGADYFRRWHSQLEHSGGLLVHKATHHFDLVNWWTDGIPAEVFARGRLAFYGKDNAVAHGMEQFTRYPRYTGIPEAKEDPFALDLEGQDDLKRLYRATEAETGYLRDQNVFRDGISIYDSMSVSVKYRHGLFLTYSLNAYSPREGSTVSFFGTKGKAEYHNFGPGHIIKGGTDDSAEGERGRRVELLHFPHFTGEVIRHTPPESTGGHGGADPRLCEQLFMRNPPEDKWLRRAGHEQGAASVLVGIAANQSIASGNNIRLLDLADFNPKATRLSELI